jgi:hypothetical protein
MSNRLSRTHAQRLAYLRANPPMFLTADAIDMIALRADRDDDLRLDRAEYRADAVPALWFARALENVDKTVYTQEMIPLVGRQVVPIDRTIPEWARNHRWQELTRFGEPIVVDAQTMASIPLVSVSNAEVTAKIDTYAIGWGWSADDIEAAARQNWPLSTMYAELAREVMERRIDQTLLVGDANTGAVGFLKMSGVPILVPSTKTGGGTAWSAAALGSEIVADILAGCNSVNAAQGVERKCIVQMSLAKAQRLDSPMTGSGMTVTDSGSTIRAYLMKNYGHRIEQIVTSPRCATAGAAGVQRIMYSPAFSSENEARRHVFGIVNRETSPMPGEWINNGLFYKQIALAKCGGVGVRTPSYFAYQDGV